MSCSGLCSVQLPSQFCEPGLISALVTAGRSAGSSAKPRLVQPGATASRCVQQFKESLFFVFFFPSSPWEVLHNPGQVPRWWLWLLRGHQMPLPARSGHAAGRSRHCCSIPALLAASWCLVQHRLVPCFFSFPAAPTGMRDILRTHTQVLRGCSAPAAVFLVLRWCLSPGRASGMPRTPQHPCTKPGMMAERPGLALGLVGAFSGMCFW